MFFSRSVVDANGDLLIKKVPSRVTDEELIESLESFASIALDVKEEGIKYIQQQDTVIDVSRFLEFTIQHKLLGIVYKSETWELYEE